VAILVYFCGAGRWERWRTSTLDPRSEKARMLAGGAPVEGARHMTFRTAFVVFSLAFCVALLGATFTTKKYVQTHQAGRQITIRHAG
jgi:hypothetical protein